MENVALLNNSRVYEFPADQIPFTQLTSADGKQAMQTAVGFESNSVFNMPDGRAWAIEFSRGSFHLAVGGTVTVERLFFTERNILFQITGTSANGAAFMERIIEILRGLRPSLIPAYLLTSEESSLVATLAVEFRDIFDPRYLEFMERTSLEFIHAEGQVPRVEVRSATSLVKFSPRDAGSIRALPINDKSLVIEPRVGTRLEERRYFAAGPTDSDTLQRFVERFEASFRRSAVA